MTSNPEDSISTALERLALTLGESGAVPVPELVRALERAAERLRTRNVSEEAPTDLVTQAEAARAIGVSRQAVNQWVRNGVLRAYVRSGASSRYGPEVSLSEVAIAANRRSREVPFAQGRRRELLDFLGLIERASTASIVRDIRDSIEDDSFSGRSQDQLRVLREFVIASMGVGDQQHEFNAAGVKLLADLDPRFEVDRTSPFGRLAESLGLLIRSAHGAAGFDSPAAAVLGLLGAGTVGALYDGEDADCGREIAHAAQEVWGHEWPLRLYDVAFHVGQLRPTPLTRYTASLTYLDYNRFLRQAQSSGVTIAYARGPGVILPQRCYGAPILRDILDGRRDDSTTWRFSQKAATTGRPAQLPSGESPFRAFHYEHGLLDTTIHGIRRYCFPAVDAGQELRSYARSLSAAERRTYLQCAVDTLARTLSQPHIELAVIDEQEHFDWWKDHIIRASPREILIGLRDERSRRTAHALLVETSMLPEVVEAADSDGSLRDRLRIYVKNLEFDVIDARYRDDIRRGVARVVKHGGQALPRDESLALATEEIRTFMR
ncbi:hypothetical protein ABZS66_00790 [Dactylosporangium sp. NPDC005572]|uniref:hypothetical protein n=1 Tax=Dactylosporangium sp. NPDC005572 TaxID=3156889 RepID=UPI0033A32C9A